MTDRPDLPNFGDPPVVEVVLSVQFEPLEGLRVAHLGLLWNEFRERFPKTEERPPIEAVIEKFEPRSPAKVGVRIETYEIPPVPRTWLLNEASTELIQVQPDRFIHNWRKIGEGDEYPRYEKIRESFRQELETFSQFLAREKVGELRFNQCEVTYVNHIVAGEGWERHGQIESIFNLWTTRPSHAFLQEPDDAGFRTRYIIQSANGVPIGRLHVEVQPAWRTSDMKPMYVLNLTARGVPQGNGFEGAFDFLNTGRKWIVEGFASITTPRMHSIWRRLDVK